MNIEIDMALLMRVLLILSRLSGLFLLTPLFSVAQVPIRIRVLFLLGLSFLLTGVIPGIALNELTWERFVVAAVYEFFIGAVLAFGLFAAFGVFLFGGRILDFQMGFGVANLIDPATNLQGPLLGTMLNIVAVMVFFLMDGHHMLIRGLAFSLQALPLGAGMSQFSLGPVIAQFGLMFVYGLMLVAPAVFALLLLDIGMGVAARTMPQVNMFIVGLPLKILLGLLMLMFSLNYLYPLLQKIYASIFQYWETIFGFG